MMSCEVRSVIDRRSDDARASLDSAKYNMTVLETDHMTDNRRPSDIVEPLPKGPWIERQAGTCLIVLSPHVHTAGAYASVPALALESTVL